MWKCEVCGREFKSVNQSHSCSKAPETIDEYIAAQRDEIKPLLTKVRATIRAAAPQATERIAWRMPTFWQGENLIHFAAFKAHLGLYPGDLSLTPFASKLEGYHTTKGAIQFPYDQPIPYDLIAEITAYRVAAVKQKQQDNAKRAKS